MTLKPLTQAALLAVLSTALSAQAAVSADEAAKLKTELTPLGAEKAGNKDGSIPAWTGGYTTPIPGEKDGKRGDPFKGEKPKFSITAKNVDQYADKLTDGSKAMFKKYPDYRIDVYETHRTGSAPQWVYDATLKNATHAKLNGTLVEGAYGGAPFPIPKNGTEVMWNHTLRWRAPSLYATGTQYTMLANGKSILTTDAILYQQLPYLFKDSPETFEKSQEYLTVRVVNAGPPIRAGEQILSRQQVDGSKDQAWVYLTGQRRVRKLPVSCCDGLTPATAGVMFFDELETWYGRFDRFDWKLAGKKEIYIPYNTNSLFAVKDADILGKPYPNPDHVRWELHRVWVVDATVAAGQRHQAPKGRYYCDEDTWQCTLGDRWDANGQLWRTVWTYNFVAPDLPGTVTGVFGFNDLLSGVGYIANVFGDQAKQYSVVPRLPDTTFTPAAMAGEGAR